MKNIPLFIGILVALAAPPSAFAKKGDKNATGNISSVTAHEFQVEVKGRTENGPLWLGCTVMYEDGVERDLKVRKVKGGFREIISFQIRPQGVSDVIVALWRWKVDKGECTKGDPGPGEWCRRSGYHMEDRIDRVSASPSSELPSPW